ncbi:hypothetical protein FRB90_002207 [Tulasnella sp. 427]|nr:hypothetical protein FRB90_002207 [Tulasnella sp. 427]
MDYDHPAAPYDHTPADGGAVTITVLPVALSLVRIPKHRLPRLAHPIIKLVLSDTSSSTFLNVSTNPSEVSIIAREEDLAPFVDIAHRDNRRVRRQVERIARRGSARASGVPSPSDEGTGEEGGAAPSSSPTRPSARSRRERVLQPVEVSSSWSALQIDSHGDQLGDASARIREISSLLCGISILYQSSYTTDYIFVQSRLLPEVLSILSTANFISISSIPPDLSSRISSLVASTAPPTRSASPQTSYQQEEPLPAELANLSLEDDVETRRGTASSHASLHSILLAKSASIPSSPSKSKSPSARTGSATSPTPAPAPARSTTRSTLSLYRPSVSVLPSDLVVVGLSEQFESHSDAWKMKLIKVLFYGDMIGESWEREGGRGRERRRKGGEGVDDGEVGSEEERSESLGYSTSGSSSSFNSSEERSTSSHSSSSTNSFHSTKSSASPPSSPTRSSSPSSSPTTSKAFFSLTRTADGSSLTSDVHVLAKLFEGQRDLIYCGDEFERVAGWRRDGSPPESEGDEGRKGFLRCLHVDLKDFDLDRHGLVNRFSHVLYSNDIHHLYCSTFKTANLLVDERDAARAQKLLSEC